MNNINDALIQIKSTKTTQTKCLNNKKNWMKVKYWKNRLLHNTNPTYQLNSPYASEDELTYRVSTTRVCVIRPPALIDIKLKVLSSLYSKHFADESHFFSPGWWLIHTPSCTYPSVYTSWLLPCVPPDARAERSVEPGRSFSLLLTFGSSYNA